MNWRSYPASVKDGEMCVLLQITPLCLLGSWHGLLGAHQRTYETSPFIILHVTLPVPPLQERCLSSFREALLDPYATVLSAWLSSHTTVFVGGFSPLQAATIMDLERRRSDLEWLLMPAERAPEITSALLQGSGLLFLRQRKHLSLIEATHLMGRDRQVIAEMEEGNWGGQATLADYRRYTEILSCSLPDVIEAAHMMRSSEQGRRQRKLDGRARLVQTEVAQYLQRSLTKRLQDTSNPPLPLRRRIRASPS